MGREGGSSTEVAKTPAEVEKLLGQHKASKRYRKRRDLTSIYKNQAEAEEAVESALHAQGRECGDNYNVAAVARFVHKEEEALEPESAAVENSFLAVADAAVLPAMATCCRCNSVINTSALPTCHAYGTCPVCYTDRDRPAHTQSARLGTLLTKIGKRERIVKSTKRHLFNSYTHRTLYPQPAYANAVEAFKRSVNLLLPALDKAEAAQPEGEVHYVVGTSWLSSHDEWQDNSSMDEY